MKIHLTALFSFLYIGAAAQAKMQVVSAKPHLTTITANFKKDAGQEIYFQYGRTFDKHVQLDAKGMYREKANLDTGYYSLVNSGNVLRIYLEPGMNLKISKKVKNNITTYTFKGKGKAENKFLVKLAARQAKYLPVEWNLLNDEINMVAPAYFINQLEKYKAQSLAYLYSKQFNNYFTTVEAAYIDCLTRKYALQYMENYGVNSVNKKQHLANLENGDASLNTPQGKQAALNGVYTKELTYDDRRAVFSHVYNGFDINNEALYKCSGEYVDLINQYITYLAQTGGNTSHSFALRRVDFIKARVSNGYIQQQMLQKYSANL